MNDLTEAARALITMGNRLIGGRASAVESGELDLTPQNAERLTRRISGTAEDLRQLRVDMSDMYPSNPEEHPLWPDPQAQAYKGLTPRALLPINRKERYYTGTVLPGIVGSDRFMHLDLLLRRCGLEVDTQDLQFIEFVTEFSLLESAWNDEERERFAVAGLMGDTPDLVIAGYDWLVVIEAKMYHRPSVQALNLQMAAQRPVVQRIRAGLGIPPERVQHVFLGPVALAPPTNCDHAVTWEEVLADYTGVGNRYWCQALERALGDYEARASKVGSNAQGSTLGSDLLAAYQEGVSAWAFVGRNHGGLQGQPFADDVASGAWATTRYQVRTEAPEAHNLNWMTLEAWATAILSSQQD